MRGRDEGGLHKFQHGMVAAFEFVVLCMPAGFSRTVSGSSGMYGAVV